MKEKRDGRENGIRLRGEAKRREVFREHGGEVEGEEQRNRYPNMEGK